MKKCLWDTIIIIELWFLQFSTKKQANKQSSVIHRFILHAALLGYLKLAHTDDQHFLFPLKKINRGMDRDGSRLLDHRLERVKASTWLECVSHTYARQPFCRNQDLKQLPMPMSRWTLQRKTCQGKPHELQSFPLMLAVCCDREYWKESA